MTQPEESLDSILDLAGFQIFPHGSNENRKEAKARLNSLIEGIIGEDYVFERPKDDYLPNTYIHLKAKNELRAEQRKRLKLLGGN